jgi:hypothetical protein
MTVTNMTCGHCAREVAAEIIANRGSAVFLVCPSCQGGLMTSWVDGATYPPVPYGRGVAGLPSDVEAAWTEVRKMHGAAFYTGAEMIARKILMHVAVESCGSQSGQSFVSYVSDLESHNYLPPNLKPVIDRIRTRGNEANHEVPSSTQEEAATTLRIVQYLLETVYEMPIV